MLSRKVHNLSFDALLYEATELWYYLACITIFTWIKCASHMAQQVPYSSALNPDTMRAAPDHGDDETSRQGAVNRDHEVIYIYIMFILCNTFSKNAFRRDQHRPRELIGRVLSYYLLFDVGANYKVFVFAYEMDERSN